MIASLLLVTDCLDGLQPWSGARPELGKKDLSDNCRQCELAAESVGCVRLLRTLRVTCVAVSLGRRRLEDSPWRLDSVNRDEAPERDVCS